MNKTIHKFKLSKKDKQTIKMPAGALILSCRIQGTKWMLWALVIPDAEEEERTFEIFGTGHPIPYDGGVERVFIETIQTEGDFGQSLVFHIFERLS